MGTILIADNALSQVVALEEHLAKAGHQVVGNAVSGFQAVEMAKRKRPDLLLTEVKLTGEMDGITAAIKIREDSKISIIFMSWYGDERTLAEASWAHPAAYLLKPLSFPELDITIESVFNRGPEKNSRSANLSAGWYFDLINSFSNMRKIQLESLTPSEIRIANLIARGKKTEEIAVILKLQKCTVQWHQKNIRRKLGLTGSKRNLTASLGSKMQFLPPYPTLD